MDSMEVNKGVAAILVAGIAFFVTGTIGDMLVKAHKPREPAIKIEIAAPAGTGAPAAAPAAPTPIGPLMASADATAGETIAKRQCLSCHTFTEGGKNGVGPNLYNVLGSAHAAAGGFNFSNALKGKPGNWTFEEMNAWLQKPTAFVPGTRMAFAGINSEKQRADVLAYLRSLSKNPVPLP
ncbi:MAG: cytochrome c family protein [Acetobacteraceae bacterium]|nr:cytochrome c family protein [Acetobacteraceae bacterium]